MEVAKRLAPKRATIRHLFAFSGNRCAFEDCIHPLIDEQGNFVAEICHIEAAEPRGPRYNPSSDNEARRHRNNLLLMCHRHHRETDDTDAFPVERMRDIKAKHEQQFEDAVARIAASIFDVTQGVEVHYPETLKRLDAVLKWDLTEQQLQDDVPVVVAMIDRLSNVAPDTRRLFKIAVARAQVEDRGALRMPMSELQQVTRLDDQTLNEHIATLERYGLAHLIDGDQMPMLAIGSVGGKDDWALWHDLREFCARTDVTLSAFTDEFRFNLLD